MGQKRNTISVIWSGDEPDLKHQRDYVEREASLNGIGRLLWKDHTPHERLCQYVGKPIDSTNRHTLKSRWNNSAKKYVLLHDVGNAANFIINLIGKPYTYYTVEKENVRVVNAFASIAEGKQIYWGESKEFTKLSELEDYVAKLNENAAPRTKYTLEIEEHYKHKGCYDGHIECSTEHDGVIQPWAMLREDEVLEAWHEVTAKHGIDTRELEQREDQLIVDYNTANDAAGKKRRPWNKDTFAELPEHIQTAMEKRSAADRDLKEVRSQLGKAKRKITNLTKKQGGLELDITKYCITKEGDLS